MAVTLSTRSDAGSAGIAYFLTAMDPRAKLKGSRDGLGVSRRGHTSVPDPAP